MAFGPIYDVTDATYIVKAGSPQIGFARRWPAVRDICAYCTNTGQIAGYRT